MSRQLETDSDIVGILTPCNPTSVRIRKRILELQRPSLHVKCLELNMSFLQDNPRDHRVLIASADSACRNVVALATVLRSRREIILIHTQHAGGDISNT